VRRELFPLLQGETGRRRSDTGLPGFTGGSKKTATRVNRGPLFTHFQDKLWCTIVRGGAGNYVAHEAAECSQAIPTRGNAFSAPRIFVLRHGTGYLKFKCRANVPQNKDIGQLGFAGIFEIGSTEFFKDLERYPQTTQ